MSVVRCPSQIPDVGLCAGVTPTTTLCVRAHRSPTKRSRERHDYGSGFRRQGTPPPQAPQEARASRGDARIASTAQRSKRGRVKGREQRPTGASQTPSTKRVDRARRHLLRAESWRLRHAIIRASSTGCGRRRGSTRRRATRTAAWPGSAWRRLRPARRDRSPRRAR